MIVDTGASRRGLESVEGQRAGEKRGRERERPSRFILMPKSNRLLHGIRDGITSYQRICTLPRCNPCSACSTNYATVPQYRVEGREQCTSGVTRELRVHATIYRHPLSCQESRGMCRSTANSASPICPTNICILFRVSRNWSDRAGIFKGSGIRI